MVPVRDAAPVGTMLVHDQIAALAIATPSALAVSGDGARLTYRELDLHATALAGELIGFGAGPEKVVAVLLRRAPGLVVAELAVLKAGAAYLPLDPAHPRERLAAMIEDSRAALVLTESALRHAIAGVETRVFELDRWAGTAASGPVIAKVSELDLAYVIYTSGSTGRPKGVQVQHDNLGHLIAWHMRAFDVQASDKAPLLAGLSFDASVWELWPYLCAGASVHIPDEQTRLSPHGLRDWICDTSITIAFLPTPLAELAVQLEWPANCSLRLLLTGGDRLHRPPPARLPFRLFNNYGPTEYTVVTTSGEVPPSVPASGPPSIGRPVDRTRIYVLEDKFQPVVGGEAGTVFVAGSGVARGYRNMPAATAENFLPDPFGAPGDRMYSTGDLAKQLPDGSLEFIGRADLQVKLRGFRIELAEVEAVLVEHPAVRQAAVELDESRGNLVAFVVSDSAVDPGEMRALAAGRLPDYMVPAAYLRLDSVPLTANGKVNRHALRQLLVAEEVRRGSAPTTSTELAMAAIWADVLGVRDIGIDEEFFSVGGNSLHAMQIVSRSRDTFQSEVMVADLFSSPTVRGLARVIERGRGHPMPAHYTGIPARSLSQAAPSSSQLRVWLQEQLRPGQPTFNVPTAYALRGELDVAALHAALAGLVARHEVLRTSFDVVDGRPLQVIHQSVEVDLPVVDARGLPGFDLQRDLEQEARRPFELPRAPLLRARLLQLGPREHVLQLTVHHIVCDGWSMSVLARELVRLYTASSVGEVEPLQPMPIQYADYAEWQHEWLQTEEPKRQLEYWRRHLAGIDVLALPADHPRPPEQMFSAAQTTVTLSALQSAGLRSLSRRLQATPFMTLLSAFALLLARLSGQDDVAVGVPVAGRLRPELEGLIGFFINPVVIRADLAGDPSFEELVQRVSSSALAAFDNQELPFERVVEELRPLRDLSRNPLFQVFFNVYNFADAELTLPGLEVAPLNVRAPGSLFDLTLYVRDEGDRLALDALYNPDLFDGDRIESLLDEYVYLLRQVEESSDRRLSAYSLVSERAAQLLPDPSLTISPVRVEDSIPMRFSAVASRSPRNVAVRAGGVSFTYAELDRMSAGVHSLLDVLGAGDVIAVLCPRSFALVGALLGVLKAGCAFCILDPSHPPARLLEQVAQVRPAAVIGLEGVALPALLERHLGEVGIPLLRVSAATAGHPSGAAVVVPPNLDGLAYVAFTSGSTGSVKGILGAQRPLSHFLEWHSRTFGLGPDDRFAMLSGLGHDPLLRDVFTPLWVGGTICVPDGDVLANPVLLARWLGQEGVSVIHLTPAMGRLLAAGGARLPLRHVFFGGDLLTATDVERMTRLAPDADIVNYYGATETPQALGYYEAPSRSGASGRGVVPLGVGVDGAQLLVLGTGHRLCGVGEQGEIHVRSQHLAAGYLNDPALTAERFFPNPFRADSRDRVYATGDLGRYLPDGTVEFAGRRDGQTKIRGFRVELGEVEARLRRHPALEDAVVVADDSAGDRRLVAYLVPRGEPPRLADLRRHLATELPDYMLPAAVVSVERIPLTPNGKPDRAALPPPESASAELVGSHMVPRTETEELIARVWREVLHLERVSTATNFFDLGGNSLAMVDAHAMLQARLGREFSIIDLFRYPDIVSLAGHLDGHAGGSLAPALRRIRARSAALARRLAASPGAAHRSLPGES